MEIKDFVGDADIKNEADLLMDMLNNVRVILELSYLRVISRKTQSVPPARKDTWLSVSFYCAIL